MWALAATAVLWAVSGAPASAAPPPPLTCNGNINGHVSASYTGTTLTSTTSNYDATMVCTRGLHGEPMTSLQETALVYLNGSVVRTGVLGQCAGSQPCLSVESKGNYVCSSTCGGDYRMAHRAVMVLPPNHEWGTPPAGCTKIDTRKLQCLWFSGTVHVQPVLG